MARLHDDSVQNYLSSTTGALVWNTFFGAAIAATAGRSGTPCLGTALQPDPLLSYTFQDGPSGDTVTLGYRCVIPSFNAGGYMCIVGFKDGGNPQCYVYIDSTGHFLISSSNNPTTPIGTSTNAIVASSASRYLQIQLKFSPTAGRIIIKDNTAVVWDSGPVLNTRITANAYCTGYFLGNLSGSGPFSTTLRGLQDIYLNDNTGTTNTGFEGDVAINYKPAAGARTDGGTDASTIGGTAPAATRWQGVSEVDSDGNVTYNSFAAAGDTDLYLLAAGPTTGTIICVSGLAVVEKDDIGTNTGGLSFKSGSVQTDQPTPVSVSSTYTLVRRAIGADPNGGGALSPTARNALLVGWKRAA